MWVVSDKVVLCQVSDKILFDAVLSPIVGRIDNGKWRWLKLMQDWQDVYPHALTLSGLSLKQSSQSLLPKIYSTSRSSRR